MIPLEGNDGHVELVLVGLLVEVAEVDEAMPDAALTGGRVEATHLKIVGLSLADLQSGILSPGLDPELDLAPAVGRTRDGLAIHIKEITHLFARVVAVHETERDLHRYALPTEAIALSS